MHPTDAIGVAFTYGTPFELSVALNAVAAGGLANLVPYTTLEGDGTLDYSLPAGDVLSTVPGTVPEPATAVLMTAGMFALLLLRRDAM